MEGKGRNILLELNVPYSNKEEAKALGARWNPNTKKWYVTKHRDYPKFRKWLPYEGDIVVLHNLYYTVGIKQCFKCKKDTRIISFAIKDFIDMYGDFPIEETEDNEELLFAGIISPIPKDLLNHLTANYNFKVRKSKTTGLSGFNNCCDHCDVLQGRFYSFEEADSPFGFYNSDNQNRIVFYSYPLEKDMVIFCPSLCTYPRIQYKEITIKEL